MTAKKRHKPTAKQLAKQRIEFLRMIAWMAEKRMPQINANRERKGAT